MVCGMCMRSADIMHKDAPKQVTALNFGVPYLFPTLYTLYV